MGVTGELGCHASRDAVSPVYGALLTFHTILSIKVYLVTSAVLYTDLLVERHSTDDLHKGEAADSFHERDDRGES